jgi:hypothetical protein
MRQRILLITVGLVAAAAIAGVIFCRSSDSIPFSSLHWRLTAKVCPSMRLRMQSSVEDLISRKVVHSTETARDYLGSPISEYAFVASSENKPRKVWTYPLDSSHTLAVFFDDSGEVIYHEFLYAGGNPSSKYVEMATESRP